MVSGRQIHHSRDLVHWRLLHPLNRPSQLNMLGDPDSAVATDRVSNVAAITRTKHRLSLRLSAQWLKAHVNLFHLNGFKALPVIKDLTVSSGHIMLGRICW
jgi:hypothetical protein